MIKAPKVWTYYVIEPVKDKFVTGGHFIVASNGILSIVSDYGNYANKWPVAGFAQKDFRAEIVEMDGEYVQRKLLQNQKEYSAKKTLQGIKEHILSNRRSSFFSTYRNKSTFSKEEAREEWDLLEENDDLQTSHDFSMWYDQTKLSDAGEFYRQDYPNSSYMMINKLFPIFQKAVMAELRKEWFGTKYSVFGRFKIAFIKKKNNFAKWWFGKSEVAA